MDERPEAPDAPRLLVRILGSVGAERDGETVALGGPRQRAVLARLVLAEGHMVPVERLVEDVWAGAPPASAVNTLQSYVSLLRRGLGDADLLRREGPGYVLDLPGDVVDARRFEQQAREGLARLGAAPGEALDRFDAALGWWRGPALADVADEEWARAAAVRLDELRLTTLEARFDALLALGRHQAAAGELERVVDEHPLRERFAAQLMLALYRCGRQADALRAFERTRRLLADELGLDPTPALVQLEAAILRHDAALAGPVAPAPAGPAPAAPEAAPPRPASPVRLPPAAARARLAPFVGREEELAVLRERWAKACDGERSLVVLCGDPGMGKTRLAARFAGEAHADGAIVLWGRASSEALVPYEPVVEALRTVLRAVSPEALHRVVEDRPALALLLPELPELAPGMALARPEPGVARYVLYETVAGLLEAESAMHPLVFVVDDLHWADAQSLRLLEHLLRHERPGRVLVVATARSSGVDATGLDDMVSSLRRDGLVTRLELDGLDTVEVAALLQEEGWDDAPAAAAAITDATGGNPFFVTELAAHASGARDVLAAGLPPSVREVIGGRYDRLDDRARRAIGAAAVAGPSVSLPVLAHASGIDGDDLLDATDVGIAAGLLTEDGPTGRLAFPHALVRQAVLERLSRTRRAHLHLRVADALELVHGASAPAAEVAHHLLEAGAVAPAARAMAAAVEAGRQALAVLAYEDARGWAERGEAVGADLAGLRGDLALLRSDAGRALGDREVARQAAHEAAEWARRADDPVRFAEAAEAAVLAVAGVGFDFGAPDGMLLALLREALGRLPEHEVAHQVLLRSGLVASQVMTRDEPQLVSLAAEAQRLADASGDPLLRAAGHLAQRLARWRRDLLDERLSHDRAALAAAREAGDRHFELTALLYLVGDLMEGGEPGEAQEAFERFRDRAAAVRQPVYEVYADFLGATRHLLAGEYAEAQALGLKALEAGLLSHGANAQHAFGAQQFVLAWDTASLGPLAPLVEDAVRQFPEMPIWRVALAACLVEAERMAEGRSVYDELLAGGALHLPDDALWFTGACFLVEVARALEDPKGAAVLRDLLEPYGHRTAVTGLGGVAIGPVSRYVGVAAHVAGDIEAADRHLTAAAEHARALGARPHVARALRDRARVLVDRGGPGDVELARALAAEARGIAEEIGLTLRGVPPVLDT